jgi:hypothetical protein
MSRALVNLRIRRKFPNTTIKEVRSEKAEIRF